MCVLSFFILIIMLTVQYKILWNLYTATLNHRLIPMHPSKWHYIGNNWNLDNSCNQNNYGALHISKYY